MFLADYLRLLIMLLIATAIGFVAGHPTATLLLACLLYIIWEQKKLHQLLRWLRTRNDDAAPEQAGVFENICIEIDRLRERHKKRKKKLSRYLSQFQQATRALPDATVVMDERGRVKWANKAAQTFLGIRWPADTDERVTNLVRKPELKQFLDRLEPDATLDLMSPAVSSVHLNLRLAPYGKGLWLLVARDVTELQNANQARSDFVANVSHELRTPITVFRGYLETLEQHRDRCPPEWLPALEQMSAHAERMQAIVEELLLLSRLEQKGGVPDTEIVPVPQILLAIEQEAIRLSGASAHAFSTTVDPDLLILGNRKELYSAFSNIVFNAVAYTPPRGAIRIRWYRDPAGAHLEVQDEGIGIPAKHIPRITERFYRVDTGRARTRGGTGLGLAIVKHVLQRHKATLHVASEEGAGSTFRCDFPNSAIIDATADREKLASG
jgi:two-component system phosphate regulon sensor histidine kinase PhoR